MITSWVKPVASCASSDSGKQDQGELDICMSPVVRRINCYLVSALVSYRESQSR